MISVKQNYTIHFEFLSLHPKYYKLRGTEVGREKQRSDKGQRKTFPFTVSKAIFKDVLNQSCV